MGEKKLCAVPCNLCGSKNIEVISVRDRDFNYLRTVICKECGLIWSDPRPSEEEVKNFYSEKYRKEYKGDYKPKLKHIIRDAEESVRRFRFLENIIQKDSTVMDIGSGTGVFVYLLRTLGFNTVGIEPDKNYQAYAVKTLEIPVENNFLQDNETDRKYDIITMHHVLEHTENPSAVFQKIRDMLKSNGFFVAEVPNAEDIQQDPHNRYHKAHLYTFNSENFQTLGKKSGFRVYKILIAPYNGNIAVIFQKEGTFGNVISGEIVGNCEKIKTILADHKTLRHFTTAIPYKKFYRNITKALREQMKVRKYNSVKEIIDSVIDNDKLKAR